MLYRPTSHCPYCGTVSDSAVRNWFSRSLGALRFGKIKLLFLLLVGALTVYTFTQEPTRRSLSANEWTQPPGTVLRLRATEALRVREGPGTEAKELFVLSAGDPVWVGDVSASGWAPVYEPQHGVSSSELDIIGFAWAQGRSLQVNARLAGDSLRALQQQFDVATGRMLGGGTTIKNLTCGPLKRAESTLSCQADFPSATSPSACRGVALNILQRMKRSPAYEEYVSIHGRLPSSLQSEVVCGTQYVRARREPDAWVEVRQSGDGEVWYQRRQMIPYI